MLASGAFIPSRPVPQVSLRKQEIADRLNAWIIFNEKNKELCEWLTQMENKVAHGSELSIEEMVEKLKKVSEAGHGAAAGSTFRLGPFHLLCLCASIRTVWRRSTCSAKTKPT